MYFSIAPVSQIQPSTCGFCLTFGSLPDYHKKANVTKKKRVTINLLAGGWSNKAKCNKTKYVCIDLVVD